MSGPTIERYIHPRIMLCHNGCVRLQIGPAIVLLTRHGLVALADCAQQAIAALPPMPPEPSGEPN